MPYIAWPLGWDQATVDKIRAKHAVSAEEVEEAVFDDDPRYRRGSNATLLVFAQAVSGRYLFIVLAKAGSGGRYRVVTAREMNEAERAYYGRQRGR